MGQFYFVDLTIKVGQFYVTVDTYYAIDTNTTELNGENPIVSYKVDGGTEKVADNFGTFLLLELKTILE